jgi:hypothetical protein
MWRGGYVRWVAARPVTPASLLATVRCDRPISLLSLSFPPGTCAKALGKFLSCMLDTSLDHPGIRTSLCDLTQAIENKRHGKETSVGERPR